MDRPPHRIGSTCSGSPRILRTVPVICHASIRIHKEIAITGQQGRQITERRFDSEHKWNVRINAFHLHTESHLCRHPSWDQPRKGDPYIRLLDSLFHEDGFAVSCNKTNAERGALLCGNKNLDTGPPCWMSKCCQRFGLFKFEPYRKIRFEPRCRSGFGWPCDLS